MPASYNRMNVRSTGGMTSGPENAPPVTPKAEGGFRLGSRGEAVREIQRMLSIPSDGVFGPQTQKAVVEFQRQNGLTVDGVVGARTLAALKNRVKAAKTAKEAFSIASPSEVSPKTNFLLVGALALAVGLVVWKATR